MDDNDTPLMMTTGNGMESPDFEVTLLEPRPFRPFKSSEEYLYAMKEDLAEWLNGLYEGLDLDADNFLEQMETGVILCQHANNVVRKAREYYRSGNALQQGDVPIPDRDVVYRYDVLPETFHARDNVSNFISWCRSLSIKECLLFETDDLVLRKNERSFILCLLEVARRGVKFGMPAPLLVQLEQEIDAEIANDDDGYETFRQPQVVTNDLRSLHQRVVELLSRCTCPSQFPMIRVADGKYRIGDTKVLIFVRILRSHVMVRVGGGWDTLAHYLDKHDPCRCRAGHRLATSAKLTMMQGKTSIPSMHVTYNRPPQAPSSTPSSPQNSRRSVPLTSPTPNRRFQQSSTSPPTSMRLPPPPPCSDDNSSSSSLERKSPFKQINRRSSSDEEEGSEEDFVERLSRRVGRKELILRDTVPSSWRYSPGIPRKEYQSEPALGNGQPRKMNSRLPSLTPRNKLKVGKVSPRILNQQNWNDNRSHSSENLYHQEANCSPVQTRNMMLQPRGTPNIHKGRASEGDTFVAENRFRRTDPKRHSSPRINMRSTENRTRLSPPKPPAKKNVVSPTVQNDKTRRMFWSPERQQSNKMLVMRKNSAPTMENLQSPVIEKLKQHSDLCSDRNFLMKIEQLIAEFQTKTKLDEFDNFGSPTYTSLPCNLKSSVDSKPSVHFDSNPIVHLSMRKSPVDNSLGKSSSKIPLPTWYPKCHS